MTSEVVARPAGPRYPQLLRTPRARWWRTPLGLLLAGAVLATGSVALVVAATAVAALTGVTGDSLVDEALQPDSPLGLLTNNLVLALLVPASVVAVLVVHRERPGFLASVVGRPRWGLLARCLALALAVVTVFFVAGFLLPADDVAIETPGTATLLGLLAVIALTTPLQAAAEEVGFRGYLSQALAAPFARPVVGTVVAAAVSGVLFALAHGAQDVWLFGDRLAFGLVASWLVWRTGGLEAAVALHVANNLVSLVWTASTGSLADALTASSIPWWYAVLDVTMMLTFAVAVQRLAGRWVAEVRREPRPELLSAPGGVGYPGPRPTTSPPAGDEHPWGMG